MLKYILIIWNIIEEIFLNPSFFLIKTYNRTVNIKMIDYEAFLK
jgi:hypothetical protein